MNQNQHQTGFRNRSNTKPKFPDWDISGGINGEIIAYTEDFGKYLCDLQSEGRTGRNALTNSQIRNFFGEVKRLQMSLTGNVTDEKWKDIKSAFLLLKPKLAYATGRARTKNRDTVMVDFMESILKVIDMVEADKPGAVKRFMNFVDFFESILAFHKAYGGKEN